MTHFCKVNCGQNWLEVRRGGGTVPLTTFLVLQNRAKLCLARVGGNGIRRTHLHARQALFVVMNVFAETGASIRWWEISRGQICSPTNQYQADA